MSERIYTLYGHQAEIRPCPLCGQTLGCQCNFKRGPFDLYDAHGLGNGSYVHVDTGLLCLSTLRKNTNGPKKPVLIDRHGCPVELPIPVVT